MRYELYVDNNDRLVLGIFSSKNALYESAILRGAETYEVIKTIAKSQIMEIKGSPETKEVKIDYKNYILNISDIDAVYKKRGMGPILKNIGDYEQRVFYNKNKFQNNSKKVKRKNKYVGKQMIAAGLAVIILGACANNLLKKEDPVINVPHQQKTVQQVEDEPKKETKFIFNEKVEEKEKIDNESDVITISLNYKDWSSTKKANITRSYYSSMITKYARMYGIDPKLAIGVATQESDTGIHKTTMDPGGATGLMQIQNEVWVGHSVSAYNFETKKVETVNITNSKIQNVESNIKIGCMILQNCMEYMDYNILAGVQCYNMGYGNVSRIMKAYSQHSGKNVDSILSDVTDVGWMDFRKIIPVGEKEYVEKVFAWLGEDVNIKNVKRNGTLVSLNVSNEINTKKVY